jgi:hypothetical protein
MNVHSACVACFLTGVKGESAGCSNYPVRAMVTACFVIFFLQRRGDAEKNLFCLSQRLCASARDQFLICKQGGELLFVTGIPFVGDGIILFGKSYSQKSNCEIKDE